MGIIFRPELADLVMAGEKTVTRRPVSDNPRSPWSSKRARQLAGRTRAVVPGRGKHGIGHVRVLDVTFEDPFYPASISEDEARLEGFESAEAFRKTWMELHGDVLPMYLWRVAFEVAS